MTQDVMWYTAPIVYCLPNISLRNPWLRRRNIDVILGLGEHLIEHLLEGPVIGRWIVTDVIRGVPWEIHRIYRSSVQTTCVIHFSEGSFLSANSPLLRHVRDVWRRWSWVSMDVNIAHWVLLHKFQEASMWIHSAVCLCWWLEPCEWPLYCHFIWKYLWERGLVKAF